MKRHKIYCLLLAIFLIGLACSDSSTSTTPSDIDEDEVIINPNTIAIDETNWLDSIQKIDSTNFTLTFEGGFDEAENWQEGDIIVSAIGEGLLRTVTSVTTEGDAIMVKTEQATLVDYIEQGRIQARVSLELEDVQKVTYLKEGVRLLLDPEETKAHKLYAGKSKGLPWKLDTKFTNDGTIEIFGDYLLETDLIFDLDVRLLSDLRYFEMSYELKNTLAVGMRAKQNLKVSSSAEIAKVTFRPIIIAVPALPVPIVITPTLIVSLGLEGEVNGEIYTDVTYQNTFLVGTKFQQDEGWNEILERDDSFGFNQPTFGINAKVEAYLSAKYNMGLYGVLSGYLNSTIFNLAEAGLNRDPCWELYLGLRGGIGASATIISIDLFDYNKDDLIDFRWPIAQAEDKDIITAQLEWEGDNVINPLELHVFEPNGSHVSPFDTTGSSGSLSGNFNNLFGPQNYVIKCSNKLEEGTYKIGAGYSGDQVESVTAILKVTADTIEREFTKTFPPYSQASNIEFDVKYIAEINVKQLEGGSYNFEIHALSGDTLEIDSQSKYLYNK